jgi:Galactose oxidase, central domain/Kelch motif/WD40-like Beta Propeller Repeat
MTDRELEQRLRAWYAADVGETQTAPDDLRQVLATIPATTPTPLHARDRRRGFTLLAVAAVLVVGGALAAGSGIINPRPVVTPVPNLAVVVPSGSPSSATPAPTPNILPGDSIAFLRRVDKGQTCDIADAPCTSSRIFIVGTDGQGAREVVSDGATNQVAPVWSPDGTRLLYVDEGKLFLIDPNGGGPQPVDTGCTTPCLSDTQLAFSSDGARLVFIRESVDPSTQGDLTTVATMDLAGGRVVELRSTGSDGSATPRWSPDGTQIVYFRFGEKDGGGPVPPRLDGIWLVDADGNGLHQLSPPTLAAAQPDWSPDGARILFESIDGEQQDIYTIRPDGTDVRRLTTDGASASATWTPDGRILFVRPGGTSPGWWTMNADGTGATLLIADAEVGPVAGNASPFAGPTWQPVGGAALVPLPWKAATAVAVGPPAPTPVPTPVPALAPGFAWTGSMTADDHGQLAESATLLGDGRVLFAGGCGTAAELYDPATGTFTPTGDMTAVRGGSAATLLLDGRVLFTGGYNCGPAGQDGIWASAELYDPATGTFSPTGSMGTPREFQTSTRLADGRVLVAGGYTGASPSAGTGITLASYRLVESSASVLKTAELYDPATGTFSPTGSMSTIRDDHTATLLQDGRVLVIGGGGEGYASQKTADLYDPATGTFSQTGSMKTGRWLHTATLLQDGRVLVTGGRSPQDSVYDSAETYDPTTGKFRSAGSMAEGRQQQTATLLPDGRIFIVGGYWSDGHDYRVLSSTEMFDPATGQFSSTGSMGAPRYEHTATLLNDGQVLIAGGGDVGNSGGVGVSQAVLYQP